MFDEINDAPLPGNDFLGYLVGDNARKHFYCFRYVKGDFRMLDSLRKARQTRRMTLKNASGALQGTPEVRRYRVFCQEGRGTTNLAVKHVEKLLLDAVVIGILFCITKAIKVWVP